MRRPVLAAILSAATATALAAIASPLRSAPQPAIPDGDSVTAFDKMATVMTSPRCQNCHTLTGFPRQGDDRHAHAFNVMRGPEGHGALGLPCSTCHGRANNPMSGVPGADEVWRLSPISMGWEGLSKGELCRHLKDPARNGNRTGAQVIDHLKTHLVTWAWSPGADAHGHPRAAPPLPYADFIKAAETWVRKGEACPPPAP
ncbi:hypothetical protein SAMN05519103_04777 [Rhizobiales bacterium GAS113]|nr:hypothetical protein SAMN05519103_04777 [Rhizobiales bacterium GAS113]SEE20359.1 hypothetical protein SAMN05519104_5479 [Rhizobiales bacterium GAS188]